MITPYLVILRVADRRALKGDPTTSKHLGSLRFGSQGESTGGYGTIPGVDSVILAGMGEPAATGEQSPRADDTVEAVPR